MAKLTQKQEKFCLAYIDTGNASEAYRQAYSTAKMKPESVNNLAFRLLQNVEITSRLSEIRKEAADRAVLTLESHLADLKMLRNAAAKNGKWSAAVAAEIARGRHSGVTVDKVELTGKDGAPIASVNITPEQLAEAVKNVREDY